MREKEYTTFCFYIGRTKSIRAALLKKHDASGPVSKLKVEL